MALASNNQQSGMQGLSPGLAALIFVDATGFGFKPDVGLGAIPAGHDPAMIDWNAP
jgi:hypothetical protein